MRILYNGLFQQLKQAGINDPIIFRFYFCYTQVELVQSEILMIVSMLSDILPGFLTIRKILKMGFPNKRIGCKRKRRVQYV